MDFSSIDKKWKDRWEKEGLYEVNPDKKKKYYITAAFPYPNSPQHIGHARTYTTTDVHARFFRLKGYNVLFPMAFHVTGTPILAMAKRIAARDTEIINILRDIYSIPVETISTLDDPNRLVMYFSKEHESAFREMGYAIDWRRKFYSFDKKFNKFIQWQFKKLKERGYVTKGEHPIPWCPSDGNAVSAHDTRGDIDPELEEVTVIKFGFDDGFLVVTTYRPETVYGVTNVWINPDSSYVKAELNGEKIYIAKEAAETLMLQTGLKIIEEIPASAFLKKKAKNLVTGDEVPIYPASFVEAGTGTGIVMSVPAHAPYDYLALRDIGKEDIAMPQVIEMKDFGPNPAKEIVESLKVGNQDDPLAEKATKDIYTKEAHSGVMIVSKYKGKPVIKAKELVKQDLIKEGKAFSINVISNGPVYCRCGCQVVVNVVKDQWFIDYGNEEWKEKTRDCLSNMSIIPENLRTDYEHTIEWLRRKACTRSSGLGTKFPFDETKMIEALSDSTIYMAFYTISHLLDDFSEDELTEEFFDYVFLGKGENKKAEKLRESFSYWYPLDSRHSATDLVRNHLPFFIFIHAAIFEKKLWPKQIVTNAFVLMDGKKMSKSMGNILPLKDAVEKYGADLIRLSVVGGADITQDTDFNVGVVEGIKSRLLYISELISKKEEKSEEKLIDRWLASRLNRKIKNSYKLYEKLALRDLSLELFYNVVSDLEWYLKRTDKPMLKEFFKKWVILISPFMPHITEEFNEILGEKVLIAKSSFPEADESKINENIEKGEELVKEVINDVENVSKLIGKKPSKVFVYIAAEWKRKLYGILKKEKKFDSVMKVAASDDELKKQMKGVQRISKQLMKNVHSLPDVLDSKEELSALEDANEFFKKEFSAEVTILPEEKGKHPKAQNALPNKPAIVLE